MADKVIQPFKVYTVREACDIIGSSEKGLIAKIKSKDMVGRKVGKGYKILGENLLAYLGSPTIQRVQPNTKLDPVNSEPKL